MKLSCAFFLAVFMLINPVSAQEKKDKPVASTDTKASPSAPVKKPVVLTNDDFGVNDRVRTVPDQPAVSSSEGITRSLEKAAAQKRAELGRRARDLRQRMRSQETRISATQQQIDQVHAANRPVFPSETQDGRKYYIGRGPKGSIIYIPVNTGEEQKLQSKRDSAQIEYDRLNVEWEALVDEARRAGFTIQQVLEDN